MTTLPLTTFWDTSKTEGEANSGWFQKMLAVTKELPGGAEAITELTISTGSITPTTAAHTVDTEGDAASDDLTNIAITNMPEGRRLLLRAADSTRTVVLKHLSGGDGQISLKKGGDLVLDDIDRSIELILLGTTWKEINTSGRQKHWFKGADVASASALPVLTDGNYFDVTGTTTITSINTTYNIGTVIKLHFDSSLTLTHHATDLILPGGENITTLPGDEAEFVEYASGDFRCTNYQRSNGALINNIDTKNAIINGNLNIWQRGTSFVSIVNDDYVTDRFVYFKSGVMVHDITRDTDVPASDNFDYSMKIDCTTIDASIDASDYVGIGQVLEGYSFKPFVGKTATLSFLVKATKTGTYCISFRNSGVDRSYVAEYTVNSSDTWEKKEVTITFDYSGGTWDYANGRGLRISWMLAVGSTYHTTKDTWQTGQYLSTSNQVNACDDTANNFRLTGIQFELGSVATEFEYRTIQQELALCQRYYEKSYNFNTAPGSLGVSGYLATNAIGSVGGQITFNANFKVNKRIPPSVTIYSPGTGASGYIRNLSVAGDIAGSIPVVGEYNARITNVPGGTDGNVYGVHFTADAEL